MLNDCMLGLLHYMLSLVSKAQLRDADSISRGTIVCIDYLQVANKRLFAFHQSGRVW